MKKLQKMISLSVIVALVVSMVSLLSSKSFAATTVDSSANSIEVTRTVKNVTNPVTATFNYKITADEENPAAVTGVPSTLQIQFNNVAPIDNEASNSATLSFAGASFERVGGYKFLVEEVSTSDETSYPVDTKNSYQVLVNVYNELDANNEPTGNFTAKVVDTAEVFSYGVDQNKKDDIEFESDTVMTHISLSKTVTGASADATEYFKFKVNINGAAGDVYKIVGQDPTVNYKGASITTSGAYTVGQDNYVYLKHGQTITIGLNDGLDQIKVGSEYSILEQDATDYKTFVDGSKTDSKSSAAKTADADSSKNATAYVNNKEETSITGIFIDVAPYIALVAIAGMGIVIIRRNSKR